MGAGLKLRFFEKAMIAVRDGEWLENVREGNAHSKDALPLRSRVRKINVQLLDVYNFPILCYTTSENKSIVKRFVGKDFFCLPS